MPNNVTPPESDPVASDASARVSGARQNDGYYAARHPATKDFIADIVAVCKKHNLGLFPTYEGDISFHDGMRVIPLDDDGLKFIMDAGVHFEP